MKIIVRFEASITRYRAHVIAYFRPSFEGSDQFVLTTSYFYDVNELKGERIKHLRSVTLSKVSIPLKPDIKIRFQTKETAIR